MTDGGKMPLDFGKPAQVLRECIAILVWVYAVATLLFFDVDAYIRDHLAPGSRWILNLKVFVIVGFLAIFMLVVKRQNFFSSTLYVIGYPLVLLCWRIPIAACKRWPLLIAFAPVIYRTISEFPERFLVYTVGAFSSLAVVISSNKIALIMAISGLAALLATHLYRSFRNSYSVGIMGGLLTLLRRFKASIEKGTFDLAQAAPVPAGAAPQAGSQSSHQSNPSGLYCLRFLTDVILDKVMWVTRSRRYDLYLIASWFYTVGITCVIFAFQFLALEKLDASSFGESATGTNFWGFLGFSLGNLTPGSLAAIAPASHLAMLFTYTEKTCALIIFVILVFTVLTAARESYKAEMDELGSELRGVADAVDRRLTEVYRMTLDEAEVFLLRDQAVLVNLIRKGRGLPELPSSVSKADATTMTSVQVSNPAG